MKMTSKLKLLLKRQSSHTLQTSPEMKSGPIEIRQMANSTQCLYRTLSVNEQAANELVMRSGKRLGWRRIKSADLGSIEDVLQCTICMERLKSPRMLPCQHTFCLDCLKNQFPVAQDVSINCPVCGLTVDVQPDNLPTNLYIETLLTVVENPKRNENGSRSPVVRFAPVLEEWKDDEGSKCYMCKVYCQVDSRCRHCRQLFCSNCWTDHANELKEELRNMTEELHNAAQKFDSKIIEFRNKIKEIKDFVKKDTEHRIADLLHEQEEKLRRTDETAATGESSVEDIKERITKVRNQLEVESKKNYDYLDDDVQKMKTFLELQQKATELIATVSIWGQNVLDTEPSFEDIKSHSETTRTVENPIFLYKRKIFTEKTIGMRDTLQRPSGMALDPSRDQIIVTCPGSGQVVILDRKFKVLKRIYHQDMMAPQGVVFLEEPSEIYVTDKWKHCIFVFNRKGELLRRVCSKGSGESQLRSPEGIAFHPIQNLLYVADTGNDRIQILKKDGTYHGSIGFTEKQTVGLKFAKSAKAAHLAGLLLNQPTDVAVSTNCVIVADCGNHKIKIFSLEGQILQVIGGPGTLGGFFKSPQAVCIDQNGNIVVGDTGNGRVQIFSSQGEFLRVVRGKGNKVIPFEWISGVLVKHNYDILVADSKSNTIHLF